MVSLLQKSKHTPSYKKQNKLKKTHTHKKNIQNKHLNKLTLIKQKQQQKAICPFFMLSVSGMQSDHTHYFFNHNSYVSPM